MATGLRRPPASCEWPSRIRVSIKTLDSAQKRPVKNGTTVLLALLLTATAWFAGQPTAAKGIPYEWNNVPRIVAIGDIHGAYDNFVAVLKNAELVDDELRWIGGETHLVQNGDVLDRGPDSRKCMDLFIELEKQAKRAGGRVHALIGNHEAMNLVRFLDYVSEEEFTSYTDSNSARLRERAFKIHYEEEKKQAKTKGERAPPEDKAREMFKSKHPLGYFEHRRAFGSNGRYGRWLRSHNAAVRINGVVFSHGDWSEELSALGIEEFNRRVRDELSGKAPLEGGVSFHLKSPLQYRGLANVSLERARQEAHRAKVDRILLNLQATRMVVGHTVTKGFIEPRFGGKHISIDVGMLELYRGGHQVALEIEGDDLRAIHPLGKVSLPDYLDESTLFDYLAAMATVDPQNPGVFAQLAGQYRNRGELSAARDTLQHLFRIPKPVPFSYHQELGDVYRELGETDKARDQYIAYIEGLNKVIDSTPDNTALINMVTRFCLKHNLVLDGWECSQCEHSCLRTVSAQ